MRRRVAVVATYCKKGVLFEKLVYGRVSFLRDMIAEAVRVSLAPLLETDEN